VTTSTASAHRPARRTSPGWWPTPTRSSPS